jgi:hypothetical protein
VKQKAAEASTPPLQKARTRPQVDVSSPGFDFRRSYSAYHHFNGDTTSRRSREDFGPTLLNKDPRDWTRRHLKAMTERPFLEAADLRS